jgi:hypothetical protein
MLTLSPHQADVRIADFGFSRLFGAKRSDGAG